jgi:hypothetical protein
MRGENKREEEGARDRQAQRRGARRWKEAEW